MSVIDKIAYATSESVWYNKKDPTLLLYK